jgi:hypothetical protein
MSLFSCCFVQTPKLQAPALILLAGLKWVHKQEIFPELFEDNYPNTACCGLGAPACFSSSIHSFNQSSGANYQQQVVIIP